MIHLKVTCDKRRTKKDGTHPVVFRITLSGKSRDIASGYSCSIKDWDSHNQTIKPKTEALAIAASRINDQKIALLEKIREFELKKPNVHSVQVVKEHLTRKTSSKTTVYEFWLLETERMKAAKRYGNARSFDSSLKGITKHKSLNIPFAHIDFKWLTDLETQMRASGAKTNTIGAYMRTLRAMFNAAINNEITDANSYPFRRYKIKRESSTPRVITITDLGKFFTANPDKSSRTYDYWNYGRLIFLLRGINFVDLATLTRENIKGNRLIYRRQKTHKMYSVELLPLVKEIFAEYQSNDRLTLLPIINNAEMQDIPNLTELLQRRRKICNNWLGKLGTDLNFKEAITTYVFRYSHANACKKLGYSKDLISESLGHGYGLAVSSAYLENYNVELIDEMNAVVCNEVLKGD